MPNLDEDDGSYCRPVDSFCCGTSLDFGVKFIIGCHILSSTFYVATCWANTVFDFQTFGHGVDLFTQVVNCFLALCSIPFIISGVSGIKYQLEIHLRIYLYWLMVTLVMDCTFTGALFLKSNCVNIAPILQAHGGSFACGASRILGVMWLTMLMVLFAYVVYVVWSKCEELAMDNCRKRFDQLESTRLLKDQRRMRADPSGLFGVGSLSMTAHPVIYGSLATPPVCGSAPLWGRKHHETTYPPPVLDTR